MSFLDLNIKERYNMISHPVESEVVSANMNNERRSLVRVIQAIVEQLYNSMEWPCGTLREVPAMLPGCGTAE